MVGIPITCLRLPAVTIQRINNVVVRPHDGDIINRIDNAWYVPIKCPIEGAEVQLTDVLFHEENTQ